MMNRRYTNKINWILDNLLPPFIRDNKLFMKILFLPVLGRKSNQFMSFKELSSNLSLLELQKIYVELADKHQKRETDLNSSCIDYIMQNIIGTKILDIACGRGFLAKKISDDSNKKVWGIDFVLSKNLTNTTNLNYIQADIENIPFEDGFFDSVICTHTLEHVMNINKAISELRRVCNNQIIIVVPRQRSYLYSFDLHLHFFPYPHSLKLLMNNPSGICVSIDNDLIFHEKKRNQYISS